MTSKRYALRHKIRRHMKIRKKSLFAIILAAVLAVAVVTSRIMRNMPHRQAAGNQKIIVVTTLFPLYDMAKHIGADRADVSMLLPPGMEPHSFEPKPGDILKINEADIFVYTGKFMEPWADTIIQSVTNKNLVVVDAGQGTVTTAESYGCEGPAGATDPHIWLDFDNAKTMTDNILSAFDAKDPEHAEFYGKNAAAYKAGLTELDSEFRAALASCRSREIVYGGHYAFGYMARRYNLEYVAAQGLSPDAEPTAKDMAKLVEQIRKNDIKYIFYEELTSPRVAYTIAGETGAKMLPLNPAENLTRDRFRSGATLFDILREDLANLKTGLGCKIK